MSSEYHCVPRWIYLIHKFEPLVPDERYLTCLSEIFFYGMVFVLKVCIMISLLGYNLVINNRKMLKWQFERAQMAV